MKEALGPINAGQGGREASPGRHCDGVGKEEWCRLIPNGYQYAYLLGRMKTFVSAALKRVKRQRS